MSVTHFGSDIEKGGRRAIRDLQGRRINIDVLRKEESSFKSAEVMITRGKGGTNSVARWLFPFIIPCVPPDPPPDKKSGSLGFYSLSSFRGVGFRG